MPVLQEGPRRTLLLDKGQVNAGKLLEIQQHHPHHQLRLEIEPLARPGVPQVNFEMILQCTVDVVYNDCPHSQQD